MKSGYSIDNPDITVASQSLAAKEISFPGYMLSNNSIKIPAANTYGDVTLTVEYCDAGEILGVTNTSVISRVIRILQQE